MSPNFSRIKWQSFKFFIQQRDRNQKVSVSHSLLLPPEHQNIIINIANGSNFNHQIFYSEPKNNKFSLNVINKVDEADGFMPIETKALTSKSTSHGFSGRF